MLSKGSLRISNHLPSGNSTVAHNGSPCRGHPPFAIGVSLERAGRESKYAKLALSFKDFTHVDLVIGKPFKVSAPAGEHLGTAGDFTSIRVDKRVVVRH